MGGLKTGLKRIEAYLYPQKRTRREISVKNAEGQKFSFIFL